MGLDFSHCYAHWSYSGFNRFRERLASEIGMNLSEMEGFDGKRPFSDFKDAIIPLLDHSDCDGELTPDECRTVAPRLRELVASWADDDYNKTKALELADGMDKAVELDEILEFR